MAITLLSSTLHRLPASRASFHGGPTRSAVPQRRKRRARLAVVPRCPVPLRVRDLAGPLLRHHRLPEPPVSAHHLPGRPAHTRLRRRDVRAGPGYRRPVPARRQPDALLAHPHLRPAVLRVHVAIRRVRRGQPPRQPGRTPRLRAPPLALLLPPAVTLPLVALARVVPCHPALAVARLRPAPGNGTPVRQPPVVISAGAFGDGQHGNRTVCFAGGLRSAGQRVSIPGVATTPVRVRHVRALLQPPTRPEAASRHPHGREAVLLQWRVREDVHEEGRAEEAPACEALRHRRFRLNTGSGL